MESNQLIQNREDEGTVDDGEVNFRCSLFFQDKQKQKEAGEEGDVHVRRGGDECTVRWVHRDEEDRPEEEDADEEPVNFGAEVDAPWNGGADGEEECLDVVRRDDESEGLAISAEVIPN